MIADLDESIRQLLIAEMPLKNGEVEISFDQPKREWSSRLSRPTVNFFLYDLRENTILRQQSWERLVPPGNGQGDQAHLKRSPYRVDCIYMLTTWGADPEDEHRLLSRCLATLFRFPVLPENRLAGSLQSQPFEITARLAVTDRLTNPAEVWSALDNEIRPSIPYIVTLAIDPWQEMTEPVVNTLVFRSGQTIHPSINSRIPEELLSSVQVTIAGAVRQKSAGKAPQAGIKVAIKGTGLFSTTDEQGHFQLGSLPPGDYTLVAWTIDGKPQEKAVKIPTNEGDYDLEV